MYVLDTNVVSELRKAGAGRGHPNVVAWVRPLPIGELFLSAISIMELETGILGLERRDAAQGEVLRHWFERQVLRSFGDRILAVDTAVARRCARMHVPDRRSDRDALIAATALVHGMSVVTRNVADFAATGAPIVNPWTATPRRD